MLVAEKADGVAPSFHRLQPVIEVPYARDVQDSIATWNKRIKQIRQELYGEDPQNPQGPKIQYGLQTEHDDQVMEGYVRMQQTKINRIIKLKEQLPVLQGNINNARALQRDFGYLFASSGISRYYESERQEISEEKGRLKSKIIKTGNAANWALIRVKENDRIGDNHFPLPKDKSWEYAGWLPYTPLGQLRQVRYVDFKEIQLEEALFKKGRHGLTYGFASGYGITFNFPDTPNKLFRGKVVVGSFGPFLESGDSGSWILDGVGKLRAIGFAGKDHLGYVIPIGWVYNDIEARTGWRIILPAEEPES